MGDHDASILREIQAMADDPKAFFWPRAISVAALRIVAALETDLAAARAEVERLNALADAISRDCNATALERNEARAERDAAIADAERLQWLQNNAAYVAVNPHAKTCLWTLRGVFEIEGQGFIAAIDGARGAK